MLQKYIERRERFFHGRDDNRTCLPFEWGIEHLGLQTNGNFETLQNFVSRVLVDSSPFYADTPTQQYEFDGSLLRFPSAIETPYQENNMVWGDSLQEHQTSASLSFRNGTANGTARSPCAVCCKVPALLRCASVCRITTIAGLLISSGLNIWFRRTSAEQLLLSGRRFMICHSFRNFRGKLMTKSAGVTCHVRSCGYRVVITRWADFRSMLWPAIELCDFWLASLRRLDSAAPLIIS